MIIAGFMFAFAIFLFLLLAFLSHLERFTIHSIKVEGNKNIETAKLTFFIDSIIKDGNFHFFSPANIFLIPKLEIQQKLKNKFPRIRNVSVPFNGLNDELIIKIEERVPVFNYCIFDIDKNKQCFYADAEGFIFAPVYGLNSSKIYLIYEKENDKKIGIKDHFAKPKEIEYLNKLINNLISEGFIFDKIDLYGKDVFVFLDSFFLKFALDRDPQKQVQNLKSVLNSEFLKDKQTDLMYIDLRFDNKIFYKFKTQNE